MFGSDGSVLWNTIGIIVHKKIILIYSMPHPTCMGVQIPVLAVHRVSDSMQILLNET